MSVRSPLHIKMIIAVPGRLALSRDFAVRPALAWVVPTEMAAVQDLALVKTENYLKNTEDNQTLIYECGRVSVCKCLKA